MQENMYYLMHRDEPACMVSLDPHFRRNAAGVSKMTPELLSPGGNIDAQMLRKWWQRRAVPLTQGRIRQILEQMGVTTPQEYLVKNLGLSLTDHYWLPVENELYAIYNQDPAITCLDSILLGYRKKSSCSKITGTDFPFSPTRSLPESGDQKASGFFYLSCFSYFICYLRSK